jgi:Zn-dependent peptidase ImmA (M78 family)
MRSFKVEVNPHVLRWARESSGYSIPQAAGRLKTTDRMLTRWESGEGVPTWDALSSLAKLYKRSVAVLLLPNVSTDPLPPADFRQLPDSKSVLSPKTRLTIRTARWLARRVFELERELGGRTATAFRGASATDDPEVLAAEFRSRLGITIEDQSAFRTANQAFQKWRDSLEGLGCFVFQFPMPIDEARGFSIAEDGKRAIVVNRSDAITARIFTLFHESGHLLLAKPGMCLPDEGQVSGAASVETFCNRFAAAVLVPREEMRRLETAIRQRGVPGAAEGLASSYRVSRYVMLGRMRGFDLISQEVYQDVAHKWKAAGTAVRARKGGRGESTVERCIHQRGRRLTRSVLEAAERNLITAADAVNFLDVKVNDLREMQAKLRPKSAS